MRFDQTIVIGQQQRAIDALADAIPALSRQKLKRAMDKGAVWIKKGKGQQRLRRATKTLQPKQSLHIYYDEQVLDKTAPTPTLIADEKHYSVWDKPSGLLSQGTQYGDHCSLLRLSESFFKPIRQCFLVHRLDSAASGLMIIAHSAKAAAAFSEQFQQRRITKRYRVEVEGLIDKEQTIDTPLEGKQAITLIEKSDHTENNRSVLLIKIETGRKHQIRRHLAGIGYPVIGDKIYGNPTQKDELKLRAIELSFYCPINKKKQTYALD